MAAEYVWSVKVEIEPIADCGDDHVVLQRYAHVFTVVSDVALPNTSVLIQVLDQMEVE